MTAKPDDEAASPPAASPPAASPQGASPQGARRKLPGIALTLAIGTVGGALAWWAALPLAWMIGAMLATTAASVAGAPLRMDMRLRTLMVTVLGVMLGSGFQPELLNELGRWSLSLAAVALYIAVAGAAAYFYFRKVCGHDRITAYFSAMPGGLAEMILVGTAMGGDSRIISLSHAARVLLVVLTVPFAFSFFTEMDQAARAAARPGMGEIPLLDLAILTACAVIGFFLGKALKLPAAQLVGPMLVSAVAHLTGLTTLPPPVELVGAAQVVVGSALGARFAGTALHLIARTVLQAVGVTAILLSVTMIFAVGLHVGLGFDLRAIVLAFSPGGLAEMSLVALAMSADAAFVATHHILRIFLVVVFAPAVFRLTGGKAREPG